MQQAQAYHVPEAQRGRNIWSIGQPWFPQSPREKDRRPKGESWGIVTLRLRERDGTSKETEKLGEENVVS